MAKTTQTLRPFAVTGSAEIRLAAADSGEPKQPTFEIDAYDGGPMRVKLYWRPVVVDLTGLRTNQHVPVLLDHDTGNIIGQSDKVRISARSIRLSGKVTGNDEGRERVVAHAGDGFKWSASIGCDPELTEEVAEGAFVKVNGRRVNGPVTVVRQARLGEVSIVAIGACETANVTIAAELPALDGGTSMNFNDWLKAQGLNPETLDDEQTKAKRVEYDAEVKAAARTDPEPAPEPKPPAPAPPITAAAEVSPAVQLQREEAAVESERQHAIRTACGQEFGDLAGEAIRAGWTEDKTKLEVLQRRGAHASRAAAVHTGGPSITAQTLQCALRLNSEERSENIEKKYPVEVLEAAFPLRRMGIRGFIQAALALEGCPSPTLTDPIETWVRASASSANIGGILGDTIHKMMLDSFRLVPSSARRVTRPLTANDFKTHTGFRLGGANTMQDVGEDGEIKHGKLTESSFPYTVGTVGEMIGLTRQQWINDDMGALTSIPLLIGRAAGLKIEQVVWAMVLANANNFFHADNKNYISGADSALGITGLGLAVRALLEQENADGDPIALATTGLLAVPPALYSVAAELWKTSGLIATGTGAAGKRESAENIWAGQWEPVVVPALKANTKKWYLFANPQDVAAIGLAFLNGVDAPTIEEVPPESNMLGRLWRGYMDFGACPIDPQGAVLSKGEA